MAMGGMLGLLGVPVPGIEYGIAASAILLGAAVAFEVRPALIVTALLVGVFAIFHGYVNGTGMGQSGFAVVAVVGLASTVFVLTALAAAFVVQLRAPWTRIAVRVAGSWIAASGLLMLGWSLRGR